MNLEQQELQAEQEQRETQVRRARRARRKEALSSERQRRKELEAEVESLRGQLAVANAMRAVTYEEAIESEADFEA